VTDGVVLQIDALSFAYPDGRQALTDVCLAVHRGERVALTGPNGAGKSTLLLHLIGVIQGEGEIVVDGLALARRTIPAIRAKVGLVFQNPDDQLFCPTVFEDVAFGPLHMGLPEDEVVARTRWALRQVGMEGYGERMPHHLSLGEKKRVSIATVLSMRPSILALDEPSAGLDPEARQSLIELLTCLPQTMLIASHDLDFVRQVCHRAVILGEGRVVGRLAAEAVQAASSPVGACDPS
jgi:cobalt/nickel transport system ATP-binding protein